jgi:hypothetical protein
MDVSKYVIQQDGLTDKSITIPVQLSWDYLGLDMAIDEYETQMITEVIGPDRDFEVSRFAHAPATATTNNTEVNYEFYFYSGGSLNDETNWNISYLGEGFTPQDVYYYTNSYTNSFFKLDFYDSPDNKKQINYFTVIVPTQQGLTMVTQMQRTTVSIKKPKFILDYIGDKEGFFFYWLKKRTFLDIDTFYMSAKFYNAKQGIFTKLMNMPQSTINGDGGDKFTFDNQQYFYYQTKLDYAAQNYEIIDINTNSTTYGKRMGTNVPIKWYEYVNPQ